MPSLNNHYFTVIESGWWYIFLIVNHSYDKTAKPAIPTSVNAVKGVNCVFRWGTVFRCTFLRFKSFFHNNLHWLGWATVYQSLANLILGVGGFENSTNCRSTRLKAAKKISSWATKIFDCKIRSKKKEKKEGEVHILGKVQITDVASRPPSRSLAMLTPKAGCWTEAITLRSPDPRWVGCPPLRWQAGSARCLEAECHPWARPPLMCEPGSCFLSS